MKQLVRKPFLLALMLSLPLWVVFNNYIVALCVALLAAFLLSMIDSLLVIQRRQHRESDPASPNPSADSHTTDSHR